MVLSPSENNETSSPIRPRPLHSNSLFTGHSGFIAM